MTQQAARPIFLFLLFFTFSYTLQAQVKWQDVSESFAVKLKNFRVFMTTDSLEGKPFKAFYVSAHLKDKDLAYVTDTTFQRRLTPGAFYEKNDSPLLVVNTTFFSFATNQNLNLVIKDGAIVSYNVHSLPGKGKDTLTYRHPFTAAIGISKKRRADVAWVYSDSSKKFVYASQTAVPAVRDSFIAVKTISKNFKKWKQNSAVAGGPALLKDGRIQVTNNEELKFGGKAINDLHPRTLMGYTKDERLIIMVIEGRNPGIASGASLTQAANLMQSVGCVEALNLDGGGSSCMLINGKETIWPSDKGKQRAIPAVFIIKERKRK